MILDYLRAWYLKNTNNTSWVIAFSGGVDSHVLLHACSQFRLQIPSLKIRAVHIDHQWQSDSSLWAAHCKEVCHSLDIPYQSFSVTTSPQNGESLEAWAREARYALLAQGLKSDEILLTAQTQDDQAETLLIQMLRGAGPKGLSSMGASKSFGQGALHRPLLHCPRTLIQEYATKHALTWIEDPSNQNTKFLRNFIRHDILPIINQRIPGSSKALARSAHHCAQTQHLLDDLAQIDLDSVYSDQKNAINQSQLMTLPDRRQKNLIRYWVALKGYSMPPEKRLDTFFEQLSAKEDKNPMLCWGDVSLRRYRGHWHLVPYHEPVHFEKQWHGESSLTLSETQSMRVIKKRGQGLKIPQEASVKIANEVLGLRCQPYQSPHTKPLKKWWQMYGVPTWKRQSWPLVFVNQQLAMVPGLFICEGFAAKEEDEGLIFEFGSQDSKEP